MLLTVLKERRASEAKDIWGDLLSRGKGWTTRAKRGLAALDKTFPMLAVRKWLRA